jgi:hypothetical protein
LTKCGVLLILLHSIQEPTPNPPPPSPTLPSPLVTPLRASPSRDVVRNINFQGFDQMELVPAVSKDLSHQEAKANSLDDIIFRTQNLLKRVKGSVSTTQQNNSVHARPVYEPPPGYSDVNERKDGYPTTTTTEGGASSSSPAARSPTLLSPSFFDTSKVRLRETEFGLREAHYNYPDGDLNDIELLLRGIPDAFDTDQSINDEVLQKILDEGGTRPSQLVYPSLYAANQHRMERLRGIDTLRVKITRLLVYSTKFGIRLDDSFLVIRGPRSLPHTDTVSKSIRVDLPELAKTKLLNDYNTGYNRSYSNAINKRDLSQQFFVGDVRLDKEIEFSLSIDDDLIRQWMNGENSLDIELYSYLAKPGFSPNNAQIATQNSQLRKSHKIVDYERTPNATTTTNSQKASKSSSSTYTRTGITATPLLFGTARIPIEGVLSTSSLNAVVNVDITADQQTHSAVMSRVRALALAAGQATKDPGRQLGMLSAQVILQSSSVPEQTSINKKNDTSRLSTMFPSSTPQPNDQSNCLNEKELNMQRRQLLVDDEEHKRQEALQFLPSERHRDVPPTHKFHVISQRCSPGKECSQSAVVNKMSSTAHEEEIAKQNQVAFSKPSIAPINVVQYIGIGLLSWKWENSLTIQRHVQHLDQVTGFAVSYKLSLRLDYSCCFSCFIMLFISLCRFRWVLLLVVIVCC